MAGRTAPSCRICDSPTQWTHSALVLGRHTVDYWHCPRCEFWFTDDPYWLAEAYAKAIVDADTGLVSRNWLVSRRLTPLLLGLFGRDGRYVDYAGGYGLLVRLMRDSGFDFYWQDRFAENLLAPGFGFDEAPGRPITAVTAIEVFEHVPDPVGFVRDTLDATGSDTIIFTTELHDGSLDTRWWYLTPMLGQHVAFYSRRTLDVLGDQLGLRAHSSQGLHMLTRRDVSSRRYQLLVRSSRLSYPWVRRRLRSLTPVDHDRAIQAAQTPS